MEIRSLTACGIDDNLDDLCRILIDSVQKGGAIGYLAPMKECDARDFWLNIVRPEVLNRRRILFAAFLGAKAVGAVQLLSQLQPNQPHRCEIAKMMVHPAERRKGIGRALMETALSSAKGLNKTLITLDTKVGDVAESLYRSLEFKDTGIVPNFALDPDGNNFHSTLYMHRNI